MSLGWTEAPRSAGCVVKAPSKWRVARTHEAPPDYQYRVIRSMPDGSIEVYQYADTRGEADDIARQANEIGASGLVQP